MWSANAIAQAQREDPDIGPLLDQYLKERKKPPARELQSLSSNSRVVWAQFELLEVVDDVLCVRTMRTSSPNKHRVVLPASLVQPALKECHDAVAGGHLGREKTLQKLKTRFWRPNLSRSDKEYCDDCLTCAKSKPRRKPKAPLQPIPSGYPMQRLHIDIVGPLPRTKRGNRFILTVQCSFTKWAEAYAITGFYMC